jgi:hypothetical protein
MSQYEDLLIDALLDRGFTVEEAVRLIVVQERVERERREEEERRRFAQWMARISNVSHGNVSRGNTGGTSTSTEA